MYFEINMFPENVLTNSQNLERCARWHLCLNILKMSRVRRLSLRGIRNFSDENETKILFFRPVTFIHGSSGTGKTTIVEALKYAIANEFPPNSEGGKFFIHDPVLTKTASVRAVIKAEIVDRSNNILKICRPLKCATGTDGLQLQIMNATLSKHDKVVPLCSKRDNFNRELQLTMGVPKPLLDNVLFCHQEDHGWPFIEDKKLNEKFDAIFDSSNINKVLENIIEHTKELSTKLKSLRAEQLLCSLMVSQIEDKEKNLRDQRIQLKTVIEKVEKIENELEPLAQRIKNMEQVYTKYKDLQIQEKSKKAEYDFSKQKMKKLEENIEEKFHGSMEELLAEIKTYEDKLKEKVDTIEEFETRITKISNLLTSGNVSNDSLKQQVEDWEKIVTNRNKILNKALMACQLNTIDSSISEMEVVALIKRLQERVQELEHIEEENRTRRAEEEKELQKHVNILRSKYLTIELEKNSKESELVAMKDKIDKIELEMMQIQGCANKLQSIESKIQKVKKKVQHLNRTLKTVKEKVASKIKLRDETEGKLNAVEEEIASLSKQSLLLSELEFHNNLLVSKEEELQKLKNKHEETVKDLIGIKKLTHIKLKNKLDTTQEELMTQIDVIKLKYQFNEMEVNSLECTVSQIESELQKNKEKEIGADESEFLKSRKLKDVQDNRDFEECQAVELNIQQEGNDREKLMNSLETSKSELAKLQTSVTELKNQESDLEKRLTLIQNIMSDIVSWDRCNDDIIKHKQAIDSVQTLVINTGIKSERTSAEAQSERDELKKLLETIRHDIEILQSSINSPNYNTKDLLQELNALCKARFKIHVNVQKEITLEEEKHPLFFKQVCLGMSVDSLKEKSAAAEVNLNLEIEKLEKKKKENWEKQELERKILAERSGHLSDLEKIQHDIDTFQYHKILKASEHSENQIKPYEILIKHFRCGKRNAETTLNKLKEQITREEVKKRNLSDNVLLRKERENYKTLQQQYSDLRNKLNSVKSFDKIKEDLQNMRLQEEVLLRERNILTGNREQLERAIKQDTEDLKQSKYEGARQKPTEKLAEIKHLEESKLCLEACSQALDTAILKYYEERVASVNRIMKKLWKLLYVGSDVSSIEIRLDATKPMGSAKRSYTYKLVQTKYGHEIDTRGRCSPGQRDLASIIIRFALAETFCKDYGTFVLDAPTRNLDQETADNLANTLAAIVKVRSRFHKNFQLIVIDHNEGFLFKLAELCEYRGFYQLFRKDNGHSSISYCRVESQNLGAYDVVEPLSEDENNENSSKELNRYNLRKKKRHRKSDDENHSKAQTLKKRCL